MKFRSLLPFLVIAPGVIAPGVIAPGVAKSDDSPLPVEAKIQIIHHGKVVQELPVSDTSENRIRASWTCDAPGWFLVRAITANERTFRFASTGPFYVETANEQRPVVRESAEFFLNWAHERRDQLARSLDSVQRDEVVAQHDQAVAFWEQKVALAK